MKRTGQIGAGGLGAQDAEDLEPVGVLQLEIGDQEIRALPSDAEQSLEAGGGDRDAVAVVLEQLPQRLQEIGIVIEDEEADHVRLVLRAMGFESQVGNGVGESFRDILAGLFTYRHVPRGRVKGQIDPSFRWEVDRSVPILPVCDRATGRHRGWISR